MVGVGEGTPLGKKKKGGWEGLGGEWQVMEGQRKGWSAVIG